MVSGSFIVLAFIGFGGVLCAVDVLPGALSPCEKDSKQPCISVTNCSGRQSHESCVMTISVPADEGKFVFERELVKPSKFEVWCMGLVSVGIVSLSGITGAVLWPIINSPLYDHVMAALIGLAVGSLTSTALFQLIPEAFQLSGVVDPSEYLMTASFCLLSIWGIFVIEAISKIVFKKRKREDIIITRIHGEESVQLKDGENKEEILEKPKATAGVAWMIIFGDGLHNFIDGMTIGAGYTQSLATGLGLSIAIACEEFPHELGDFAILLKSGLSLPKAIGYNFLSACTAFIGLILGILLGQLQGAHYIFAFAGGIFLYVSLTHLIPELQEMLKTELRRSRCGAMSFFVLQNIGMLVGMCIIYLVTRYNDKITNII